MALSLRSLHDLPSPNGTIDRRYPLGNAPVIPSATLDIDLNAFNAANIQLTYTTGTTVPDINYRQFLTGTSASTAVLSVSSASGFLGNWVIDASGNGITNPLTTTGSGSLFVSATNGTITKTFPVQSWAVITANPTTAIKLPVGNGFWFDNQFWYNSSFGAGAEQTAFLNNFNTLSANPLIKYVYLTLTWGHGEGPTRGDYSRAFAAIDAMLAKLATANHKMGLILEFWQTFFNTQSTTDLSAWPQYVVNNNWVVACIQQGAQRTQLKWDIDDLWAAYGDMLCAILDRYNSHPLFFGLSSMDESVAISKVDNVAQPGGLSPGATIIDSVHYNTQFLALQKRMKDHGPNVLIYVPLNYLPPGDSTEAPTMANMITSLRAKDPYGFIYGGPDPFLRQTTFQKLVAGQYQSTTGMGDIRKQILLMNRTQEAFLKNSTPTPTTNYDTALANNAVCLTWNCETWLLWKFQDELATINAHNGVAGTPPSGGNYLVI